MLKDFLTSVETGAGGETSPVTHPRKGIVWAKGSSFLDVRREVNAKGANLAKLALKSILSLLNEGKLNQGPLDSETILEL